MRFSEMFLKTNANIKKLSNIGSATFGKGITDKNKSRTPHYEIESCINMFETNPIVQSGIDQLSLFIIPNKQIKISSSCEKTKTFLEEWHYKRKGIMDEYRNILTTNLICGNGPMEKSYIYKNGQKILDNIFSMNDMSKLYINPDDIGGPTNYVFKLDVGIKNMYYNDEWQQPDYYRIRYVKNYNWYMEMVYGMVIPGDKISIYKTGWSRDNIYGRTGLASAIDSNNILNEILSSWDTISKTRQIDMKLFSVADQETGDSIPQEQLDDLAESLSDSEDSFKIINVPLKNLFEKDIKVSGNYDLMENVFDITRRMLMMSLLPNHLTPWGDSATTQGSEAAMPPFLLRIKAKQNELINWLNQEVIDELRKGYPWLAEDATFVFDEPLVVGHELYIRQINEMVQIGVLTKEDAKRYLIKTGILDEDILINKNQTRDKTSPIQATSEEEVLQEKYAGTGQVKFATFKQKLQDKKINTDDWKEIEFNNIGGRSIRLIQTPASYLIYDGLIQKAKIDEFLNKTQVKDVFNNYIQKVKEEFEEFDTEKTEEDIILDNAQDEIKKLIDGKLEKLFKTIPKTEVKKEAFLGTRIFDKFDDIFKGITPDFNKIVSKTLNKLGMEVVDTKELKNKKNEELINEKKKLLIKTVKDQMKNTKNSMLTDIKRELSTGIAAGKSPAEIKKEIEKSYNYEDGIGYKFDRAFQTSMRQSSGLLKLQKWKKMGYEEFQWFTKEDSRVRPEHAKKNKKVFKIDDALKSNKMDAYAGKDYNCRCMMIPYA